MWQSEVFFQPATHRLSVIVLFLDIIAVATDAGLLRFFTISGLQIATLCLQGPPVTMTARNNLLLIVFLRRISYQIL